MARISIDGLRAASAHQPGEIFGVKVRPSAEPLIKSSRPRPLRGERQRKVPTPRRRSAHNRLPAESRGGAVAVPPCRS